MRLARSISAQSAFEWEIVVVDNGSTDRTFDVASNFTRQHSEVQIVRLAEKGLKHVWLNSPADILSYMDADLSSDLDALPDLVAALAHSSSSSSSISNLEHAAVEPAVKASTSFARTTMEAGKLGRQSNCYKSDRGRGRAGATAYDLATGSRLLHPRLTTRSLKREFISRGYNYLVKAMFGTTFSDAQCGFKAITRSAAQALLPRISDDGWFFDTELLVTAEKLGYRIFDRPVRWVERRETHVKIISTVREDIKGLLRVKRNLAALASSSPKPSVERTRVLR